MKTFLTPLITLSFLTIRQIISSKKLYAILFFVLLPAVIGYILTTTSKSDFDRYKDFNLLMYFYTYHAQLIFLGLVVGLGLLSSELEDDIGIYIFTGRLHKWVVLAVKYLASTFLLGILCSIEILLIAIIMVPNNRQAIQDLPKYILIACLGILPYLAFFVFFTTLLRKAISLSFLACFFWEVVIAFSPTNFAPYTITNSLKTLMKYLIFDNNSELTWKKLNDSISGWTPKLPSHTEAILLILITSLVLLVISGIILMLKSLEGKRADLT